MPRSFLVLIYGAPLAGKSTLAWSLARGLPGKTAVVSLDGLLQGAIARPDEDVEAELDMVHIQLRLLVANYLKNGYHVVAEGPFRYVRAGAVYDFESDIEQTVALMRQLTSKSLVVQLDAAPETLRARAHDAGREDELDVALRLSGSYRRRTGERYLAFDSGTQDVEAIAAQIRTLLLAD